MTIAKGKDTKLFNRLHDCQVLIQQYHDGLINYDEARCGITGRVMFNTYDIADNEDLTDLLLNQLDLLDLIAGK